MEQDNPKAFLGVGFGFPIQADKNTGRIRTVSYEEDIKEAIRIILSTRKGERIRNPAFGCGIYDHAFDTMDFTTLSAVKHEVELALVSFEPRIEEIQVTVHEEADAGKLLIGVGYVVRSTNSPYNMVFPYYIREGHLGVG